MYKTCFFTVSEINISIHIVRSMNIYIYEAETYLVKQRFYNNYYYRPTNDGSGRVVKVECIIQR